MTHSTPGISGYDPVSYFTKGMAQRGSGYHVADHEGVTYAFASEENKELFQASPNKYAPAYGGWCAYGVAVGKKFVADPTVWKIVDGTLYLNLDRGIQSKWNKDIPGHIETGNANWKGIKDKAPGRFVMKAEYARGVKSHGPFPPRTIFKRKRRNESC